MPAAAVRMEIVMWTVVYMSQDKFKVDRVMSLLESNEVITMLKAVGEGESDTDRVYEILVPQTELETAQEIIVDTELENEK